jgi:ABC-type anion transport system duplicated permease subunit
MDNRRRTLNDIISTTFLLNVGTVPTVWYIFFHFIIGYEKKTAELQLFKKYGCDRLP